MENWLEKLIAHEANYFRMVATVLQTPYAWFLHGPTLPDFRDANHAMRLRDDGRGPEAVAREIVAFYNARRLPVVADVDAIAEVQGIGRELRRMGVTPLIGDTLLMRYPGTEPPAPYKSGTEIQIVPTETGAGEAYDWRETVVSEDVGDPREALWRGVVECESRYPECRLYLGLQDGKPAGACDLFASEGWGRIESVATRREFRRRGVASALVTRAVSDSLAMGNEVTYLYTEAGGDGEQVYRKLGFVIWEVNVMRRHLRR